MTTSTVRREARAKVNLFLKITGKRPDGYHELLTVFQELDLADTIRLTDHEDSLSLSIVGGDLPVDDRNLVMKAACRLREATGITAGADMILEKSIPIAAGLGGGSSDAAATLIGLCRLWNLTVSESTLFDIARELGADVPFFLQGGRAIGRGIGDVLESVESLPPYPVLLAKPLFDLSTAWVYKNFNRDLTKNGDLIINSTLVRSLRRIDNWEALFYNDLEQIVCDRFPDVKRLKVRMIELGARAAMMTGSGPTVFGVFDHEAIRDKACEQLSSEPCRLIRTAFRSTP